MIIKKCPYCIQRLPILNLIKQRLTIKKGESLVCPHCGSRVSLSTGAHIGFIVGGSSMAGFIFGKLASKFSQGNEIEFFIGITVALLIFLFLTYISTPIRSA
jgi:DNA-directed RNA polymerase subunit RPC12/RpoP